MRRSSNATLQSQTSEPLIVVEDSNNEESDDKEQQRGTLSRQWTEEESPTTMNPYLLSPFAREIRKHSLPTPQCAGITASQVRRLSERGETAGPGPRQTEFLATLSTAPAPSPGGRRHSVVTISKLPPALFGRSSRRESVAAYSSSGGGGGGGGGSFMGRILPNRRESIACPPSTEPRGSVHNLQLDIMDDIVQARKVRMKLWNTSNERVCEVQPLDEGGAAGGNVQRYTNAASSGRRFSDFVGTTLAPIPSSSKRRASELPQTPPTTAAAACASASASKQPTTGIVCTNTDLISILSSLSTSATEINQYETGPSWKTDPNKTTTTTTTANIEQKRSRLKSNRSNSFDVSILHATDSTDASDNVSSTPSSWFIRRHQPLTVSKPPEPQDPRPKTNDGGGGGGGGVVEKEPGRVVWDERSGSMVDAHALGSAIEVFLRQANPEPAPPLVQQSSPKSGKSATPAGKGAAAARPRSASWFSNRRDDDSSNDTCDSSLCSTLKDLFVK